MDIPRGVMDAIRAVKHRLPEMQLIAGNVGTFEGARDLIALGLDGIKVWHRVPDRFARRAW